MITGEELDISSGRKTALKKARKTKFDEFFTPLPDIEAELGHYRRCFKGKTVFCNTDYVCNTNDVHDKRNSMFFTYFYEQFERLGLRALICTWWEPDSEKLHAVKYDGTEKPKYFTIADETSGSFDGKVSLAILDACDIVVTNPPFSMFREFFNTLIEHKKDYIIVAPGTAPTYRNIFVKLKNDECRVGYNIVAKFFTTRSKPEGIVATLDPKTGRYTLTSNSLWLTNLNLDSRPQEITLWNTYEEGKFIHYHNIENSIEVVKCDEIPKDWPGLIGTSTSFFWKYNPAQFKIWGMAQGLEMAEIPGASKIDEQFIKDYKAAGGRGQHNAGKWIAGYYENGIAKIPFARIIIQNRKFIKDEQRENKSDSQN